MRSSSFKDWSDLLPDSVETLHVFPKHRSQTPRTDYLTQFYTQYALGDSKRWVSHSIWGYASLLWANPAKEAVHQHWLEATNFKGVLAWCWKWVCLQLFMLKGGRMIWTCHNVEPHEKRNRWLNIQIQQWLMNRAASVLVHCSSTLSRLHHGKKLDNKGIYMVAHPSFDMQSLSKDDSRNTLRNYFELDDYLLSNNVLLYFGNIASYKQIPQAIEPFLEHEKYVFWIVGPTKPDGGQTLEWLAQQAAQHPNRFWIHPIHVNDEETEQIVSAADVMMFNHRTIEMSGGVALGLSVGIHTVAPATGCIKDLTMQPMQGLNTDNLHTFTSSEEMIQIVDKLCSL